MKSRPIARLLITLSLLMAMTGCVLQESTARGPIEKVDQQKVLEKHIELGFKYFGRNDINNARKHLAKALDIDPQSSQANTGFALVYDKEGETELADQYFRRGLKGDSGDTQSRFYYAVYLMDNERFSDARKHLLVVTGNVDYSNRILAFAGLGQVELKLGDMTAARQAFEKALRLNSSYPQPHLELANLEYLDGNYDLSSNYLDSYTRLSRRKTARSLWLGVRLAHRRKNRDLEASCGLALEKMYPDSKENIAYQQWRKKR